MCFHFTCYRVVVMKHRVRRVTEGISVFVSLLCHTVQWANIQKVCCLGVGDPSLVLLLRRSSLSWQLTSSRGCFPSSEIKFLLSQAAYWIRLSNTGVVLAEQTTWALKTTSGCLLIPLKASVFVLIWFTKGGQLGNRFCIELLQISSFWNNATSLCNLMPDESSACGVK